MVKIIQNYILNQSIGQGNFGTVYRATNKTKINQQFAVKVIPICKFHQNQKLQLYTTNQIQALTAIGTTNHIIRYYEMIKSKHNYYFVYEYCDGGTLMDILRQQQKLDEKIGLLVLRQLIEGFKVLNRNNIMHRDLKPQNVFFKTVSPSLNHNSQDQKNTAQNRLFYRIKSQCVKIGDFGFCKGLKPEQNLAKTMLGSPIYMAPQVLKGQSYTSKADIWSLGVLLYQMLYGICPFQSNSIAMLINTIDTKPVYLPPETNVSDKTQNLIKRMLTKDFYRRIGWAELFGYRINDEGQYIIEASTSKSHLNQQKGGQKPSKRVFNSLFISATIQPPRSFNQLNKSYSMNEDEQQQCRRNLSSLKNKKDQLKLYGSPGASKTKLLQSSVHSNRNSSNDKKEKDVSLLPGIDVVNSNPRNLKQAQSPSKQDRRFQSAKYMSILSTPLSLNKKQRKNSQSQLKQEEYKGNNIQQNTVIDSFQIDKDKKDFININIKKDGNIDSFESELVIPQSQVRNRNQKIMSMVDIKDGFSLELQNNDKISSPCTTERVKFNEQTKYTKRKSAGNSHQYQIQTYQKQKQKIETINTNIQRDSNSDKSNPRPLSNNKREILLNFHSKIVKVLCKTATLIEEQTHSNASEKQNNYHLETSIQDFLHDMYLVLKLLQQKLKQITGAIKIIQTNLLDMASIINYELIQVERMLIEVRNEIVKSGCNMPQWNSNYNHSNNMDQSFEKFIRSWKFDLSGFRVEDIKGFILTYCQ